MWNETHTRYVRNESEKNMKRIDRQDETAPINEAIQLAWRQGQDIDDALARKIARYFAGDSGPLREFVAAGAISPELEVEFTAVGVNASEPQGIWLAALKQYCQHRQDKGPVAHWNEGCAA